MIGRTIGHYRIVDQLGRGGWGTVYRAVDETLDRDVAIKVLNPDLADSDAMTRFRAEATILARLNHPAIATIYDLFWSDNDLLMVMEFVRGETLDSVSSRMRPLPPDRAAYLIDQILSALGHAHREGVVHRDMKPANVMVTETGGVKIMDFGIARVRDADHTTSDGSMIGTPAYMPPEQVLNQEIDGRTDLYAVGVILYRLLTGALPFEADTPVATLQRQISDAPTPLHLHRNELPDWCEAIVQRALAKSPADRFQTAEEFRDALAQASGVVTTADRTEAFPLGESASPSQRDSSWIERTLPILPRRKPLAYVASALVAVAATVALFMFVALHRPVTHVTTARELPPAPVTRVKELTPTPAAPAAVKTIPAPSAAPADPPPPKGAVKNPVANRLVFDTKMLVEAGHKQRTRDAMLVLADSKINIMTGDDSHTLLQSVAYDSVTSISYSFSHDPMWHSPKGPAVVTRAEGGMLEALGIFVDRHWISLSTNTTPRFIVLRVSDTQVGHVLAALHDRTGLTPQRLGERKRKRES